MRGLVVLVTIFILLIYVGVWVAEIIPNPESWFYSTFALLKLCFVHSLLGITIYTYYLAIVTPPGKIPADWKPAGCTQSDLDRARQNALDQAEHRGKLRKRKRRRRRDAEPLGEADKERRNVLEGLVNSGLMEGDGVHEHLSSDSDVALDERDRSVLDGSDNSVDGAEVEGGDAATPVPKGHKTALEDIFESDGRKENADEVLAKERERLARKKAREREELEKVDPVRRAWIAAESEKLNSLKTIRYCVTCKHFKPCRTHHCRDCNRCTPRMDHHCPWVNNCVGNNNHKYFVLFLIYASTGCAVAALLQIRVIFRIAAQIAKSKTSEQLAAHVNPVQVIVVALSLCLIVPLLLGIFGLLMFQLSLAASNTTTIENHEKMLGERKARRSKKKFFWPYNYGTCKNLHNFFGDSKWHWLMPVRAEASLSGGLHFVEVDQDGGMKEPYDVV